MCKKPPNKISNKEKLRSENLTNKIQAMNNYTKKKSTVKFSIPTANSLTARNPTKKILTVRIQTTEILLRKSKEQSVWLKNFMAKHLTAKTSKLRSFTA